MKDLACMLVAAMVLVSTGAVTPLAKGAEPTLANLIKGGAEAVEKDFKADLKPTANSVGNARTTAFPTIADGVALEKETEAKYNAAVREYLDYRQEGYKFRQSVFEWQMLSSRIIFVIVVLLVLAGIYFAAVQFHVALAAAQRRTELEPKIENGESLRTDAALSLQTQLEITAKGIVINSSILGVIVLGLSLGFFYLYLVHVYPINDAL